MNEQRIEELKNALREILRLVSARNAPLTPELRQAIAQVTEHVATRIQQLQQQESPADELQPQRHPEPELHEAMPSSNVGEFGYDEDRQRLLVRFLGKYPNRNGPIYGYDGVPKVIFELFQAGAVPARTDGQNKWGKWWRGKVPSAGASLYTLIKNGEYPYQRLS
jgi:hypothetical protein